eukprot:TRINITY_DN225_c0_g1_i3.p1 TRINITY_DN225_c0_g1~~TRINITY_DN225_c0_g1_i3.p1  ORF type:complete len:288 (+),score=55.45 TRINITY_DN225_c0_g1_i3:25-864(+)
MDAKGQPKTKPFNFTYSYRLSVVFLGAYILNNSFQSVITFSFISFCFLSSINMRSFFALLVTLCLFGIILGQSGFDSSDVDSTFDNLVEEEVGPGAGVGGGEDTDDDEDEEETDAFGSFYGVLEDEGDAGTGDAGDASSGRGASVIGSAQNLFSADLRETEDETYYGSIVGDLAENVDPENDDEDPTIQSIYDDGVDSGAIEEGQGNQDTSIFRGGSAPTSVFTRNGPGNGVGAGAGGEGVGNGQFISGLVQDIQEDGDFGGSEGNLGQQVSEALGNYR